MLFDQSRSVQQLENDHWKDYDYGSSLIRRCHEYRKIPVKDLTTGQIRLLIGQDIGLKFLVPKALEILRENILAEGDFYPGDLLKAVLTCEPGYWDEHPDLKLELKQLLSDQKHGISETGLLEEIKKFCG